MISVCIPTFNGSAFIGAQIESILISPLVTELLISDDGSTDDTVRIIQSFTDPRVHLVQGPKAGLIRNYESLLVGARGEFIFLADQDDVWLPEKVEVMLRHLQDADLVVCDCAVTDPSLNVVNASFFALRRSGPGLLRNLVRNSYLGCCIAIRRELLQHALPFPPRVPMHDWWLGLVAEQFGRVAFVPRRLMLYRRHAANASTTAEPSRAGWGVRLRWRASLIGALLARRWGRRAANTRIRAS